MKLDQIFYGRGENGYGILAASIPACGLTDLVKELCESVGTPGAERDDDDVPFLIQKSVADTVLMICGRTGKSDSLGRRTLFFHALCASREEVRSAKISAYSLYLDNRFVSACPVGSIAALEIAPVAAPAPDNTSALRFPAAVKCRRADNLQTLKLLGEKALSGNWATFSWRPLPDFDFFGIEQSLRIGTIPETIQVYDIRGVEIRSSTLSPARQRPQDATVNNRPNDRRTLAPYVLFGAIGLVIGSLVGASWSGAFESKPRAPETPKPIFDERFRIHDFEQEIGRKILPRDRKSDFVESLRYYVNFINDHFRSGDRGGEK